MIRLNSPRRVTLLILMSVLLPTACREDRPRAGGPPLAPGVPPSAPREAERLRSLALDVQTPSDAYAEAEAIRRLRRYMTAQDLTYTIRATRPHSETVVESPSVASGPVRVTMEVFRGREPMYTFAFTPRDNRNLALLGQ